MNSRYSSNYRRYPHSSAGQRSEEASGAPVEDIIKKIEDIPLPNQKETSNEAQPRSNKGFQLPFGKFFKRIGFEEIILIGLIFLLLNEGVEDDFLLVILIYILISGFEF